MSNRTDIYSFEEVASIIDASKEGASPSEISSSLKGKRTTGAIGLLLKHFALFANDRAYNLSSNVLKQHFTRYLSQADGKAAEVKTGTEGNPVTSEATFQQLKTWLDEGGKIIMAHIQAEVENEVAKIKGQTQERVQQLEKENEELREKLNSIRALSA